MNRLVKAISVGIAAGFLAGILVALANMNAYMPTEWEYTAAPYAAAIAIGVFSAIGAFAKFNE